MADEYKVVDPMAPPAAPTDPAPAPRTVADSFEQRLYDHDAGKWIIAAPDKVTDLIMSGKYTFEAGVRVPVISPEGDRYTVPAEKVYDAFKEGFRPASAALSAAADQLATEKSNQKIYGNQPLEAAVGGFLRGSTLGLSDSVLAEGGLGEGAAQVKDRNVGASLAGEAGGIAFSTLYGGPVGAGARDVASAGMAAGEAAFGRGIGGRIAGKVLGSAAEGAYFGVGSGITEASLGHPDSVVDTLAAHVGLGALVGGVAGGVFGGAAEAKPVFDSLVNRAATGAADAVNSAARKALVKGAVPLLNHAGVADARELLGEMVDDPEVLKWVVEQGGVKGVKAQMADIAPLAKTAKTEAAAIRGDIDAALSAASDNGKQILTEVLDKTGRNVYEAARLAELEMEGNTENLHRLFASQASKPATTDVASFGKLMNNAVEDLRATNSAATQKIANNLDALGGAFNSIRSQADEAAYLYNVTEYLNPYLKMAENAPGRSAIGKLWQAADEALLTHPNPMISTTYGANKLFNAAFSDLRDIADASLSRTLKSTGEVGYDAGKGFKTLLNPESRQSINTVLDNFDVFGAEFKRYQEITQLKNSISDIAAKAEFQQQLESRIKALAPGAKVNADEVESIFALIGKPKNLDGKIEKLREIQSAFQPDTSAIDKLMAIKRALGQDTKDVEKYSKYMHLLKFYDQTASAAAPSANLVKGVLGHSVGGLPGLLYGLQKSNVQNYINSVATLHTATTAGAKLLSRASNAATEALTSKTVGRVVANEGGDMKNESVSIKDQRERYKAAKNSISAALAQPNAPKDAAPQVSKALQQRQQQALKFLQQKMPKDPFQQSALNINDSGYMPSDYEVSKFNRYVAAVNSPVTTLNSIAAGHVTPEEVETLKEVYPRVYGDLQKSVLDAIIEKRGDVGYKQKVNLATLFDIPTDYTLQSDFVGRMQNTINKSDGGRPDGTGNRPATTRAKLDLQPMETLATSAQKVTYRS